jgi:hypothetical protein
VSWLISIRILSVSAPAGPFRVIGESTRMSSIPHVVLLPTALFNNTGHAAEPLSVLSVPQEIRKFHMTADGLPADAVSDVRVDDSGPVYAKMDYRWVVLQAECTTLDIINSPKSPPNPGRDTVGRKQPGTNLPWSDRIPEPYAHSAATDGSRSWLPVGVPGRQRPLLVRGRIPR